MKFNKKDVNYSNLMAKCKVEADGIYNKPNLRRGRTHSEILSTSMYGVAAERYLIEHCGYSADDRQYKDVIDPDGECVEVKVTKTVNFVPYVLKHANDAASEAWRGYPSILYIFIGDKATGDYYLYSKYQHDGTQFIAQ